MLTRRQLLAALLAAPLASRVEMEWPSGIGPPEYDQMALLIDNEQHWPATVKRTLPKYMADDARYRTAVFISTAKAAAIKKALLDSKDTAIISLEPEPPFVTTTPQK